MLSRETWVGSHTMNVAVWSGDIDSTFEELLKQIKVAQNVALSGIYWWTTDIGGYRGGNLGDDVEVISRLNEGDIVVVSGQINLKNKAAVTISNKTLK